MLGLRIWIAAVAAAAAVLADQPALYNDAEYDEVAYGRYPNQTYRSDPVWSPRFNFVRPFAGPQGRCDNGQGLVFVTPHGNSVADQGPLIVGLDGTLVWTTPAYGDVYNLRVQQYDGRPVLTFWTGDDAVGGHGQGEYVVLDQQYQEVLRVQAGNGMRGDLHEFLITPADTALMSIYNMSSADLSSLGATNASHHYIWDSVFQEVNISSGDVLFEWRASEHFDVNDAYNGLKDSGSPEFPWDWYHINSIDKDSLGNYLISSRYLWHVAYIDGNTGAVLWTLGGKKSSFKDMSGGAATSFAYQHDARWVEDHSAITLFDNAADNDVQRATYSRGMRIKLDLDKSEATLETSYADPLRYLSKSQGSLQTLPNGNVLLGYGYNAALAEFDSSGNLLCEARFEPLVSFEYGRAQSYRTMRFNWVGKPSWSPKVVFYAGALYFSWLGSTEVRAWGIQDAFNEDDQEYRSTWSVEKRGFEASLAVDRVQKLRPYVRVLALDADGREIGQSAVMHLDEEREKFAAEMAGQLRSQFGLFVTLVACCIGLFALFVLVTAIRRPRLGAWQMQHGAKAEVLYSDGEGDGDDHGDDHGDDADNDVENDSSRRQP